MHVSSHLGFCKLLSFIEGWPDNSHLTFNEGNGKDQFQTLRAGIPKDKTNRSNFSEIFSHFPQ